MHHAGAVADDVDGRVGQTGMPVFGKFCSASKRCANRGEWARRPSRLRRKRGILVSNKRGICLNFCTLYTSYLTAANVRTYSAASRTCTVGLVPVGHLPARALGGARAVRSRVLLRQDGPPKLVSLDDGSIFAAAATPISVPSPAPAAVPTPTRTSTAPTPAPAAPIVVVREEPAPAPTQTPVRAELVRAPSSDVSVLFCSTRCCWACAYTGGAQDTNASALKEENAWLAAELRDARAQIRNLELQVETVHANARKVAALLDS